MRRVTEIGRDLIGRDRHMVAELDNLFRRHVRVQQADMAGLAAIHALLLSSVVFSSGN